MGNVFKDEKAPFILVLMIGLVGWMFNSALDSAKNLRIIEYRYVYGKDGNVDTVTYYIANRSLAAAVNAGQFAFRCPRQDGAGPDASSCLRKMPSINAETQYVGGANFGLPDPVGVSEGGALAEALIPPKTEVGFRIGVKSADTRLAFAYILSPDDIKGDKSSLQVRVITPDRSAFSGPGEFIDRATIFVIANYLSVLVTLLMILVLCIGAYICFAAIASIRRKTTASEKETFHVTIDGSTNVVSVEKI